MNTKSTSELAPSMDGVDFSVVKYVALPSLDEALGLRLKESNLAGRLFSDLFSYQLETELE